MSALTIETDHEGAFDALDHEFTMNVESDDGVVEEGWKVTLEISDLEMDEFEFGVYWVDIDTGEEYLASPVDIRVRDEIELLIERTMDDVADAVIPHNPWGDVGVTQKDFL